MYDYVFFTDVTNTVMVTKPIGIYKIAHVLRERGRKCLVVDHFHSWTAQELEELASMVIDKNTKAIGFSNTFMMNSAVPKNTDGSTTFAPLALDDFFPQGKDTENRFVGYCRKINPDIKIIIGGTQARADFANRNADIVVLGYGESAILSIDDNLCHGTDIPFSRKNLWRVTVIDDRSSIEYDFQHSNFEWVSTDVVNSRVLPIEISRGCIFKCSFCSYPMRGKKNLDFVRMSNILRDELQQNHDRYGVKTFWILDDTFNDNEYKLALMFDAVKQLSFQPEFWAYLRLDLLSTRKHVERLYDIGIRYMYFGIETLNPRTGRAVGKGYDREKQIETIQYIHAKYPDVRMHGSFIVGLPYESVASCQDTVEKCMSKTIPLHSFQIKGLRIRRKEMIPWASDIDNDPAKFGYTLLPTDANSVILNWQNEHTNNLEATVMGDMWTEQAHQSQGFKLPGQDVVNLKNFDYSDDFLKMVDYRDFDWHDAENKKTQFIEQYKKQITNML